jgi:hypothetical protein
LNVAECNRAEINKSERITEHEHVGYYRCKCQYEYEYDYELAYEFSTSMSMNEYGL